MGDIPIVLVGTKLDLRDDPITRKNLMLKLMTHPISYEQGELMARKMGCITYIETSSLMGIGLNDMTQVIVKGSLSLQDPNVAMRRKKTCCVQ